MWDEGASSMWIIVALAVLAVGGAIVEFLRTPREQRYRGRSLDEQLQRCPPSAEAVIIKADGRRALRKAATYIICIVPPALFMLWLKYTPHPECAQFLGVNGAYLAMLLVCYGLPVGFFLASVSLVGTGIRTLRTGYFPPLDSALFASAIARKGPLSRLRGAMLVAMPAVALYILVLGHDAYTEFSGGKSARQVIERLRSKCR
jgi:hypothetical protein